MMPDKTKSLYKQVDEDRNIHAFNQVFQDTHTVFKKSLASNDASLKSPDLRNINNILNNRVHSQPQINNPINLSQDNNQILLNEIN